MSFLWLIYFSNFMIGRVFLCYSTVPMICVVLNIATFCLLRRLLVSGTSFMALIVTFDTEAVAPMTMVFRFLTVCISILRSLCFMSISRQIFYSCNLWRYLFLFLLHYTRWWLFRVYQLEDMGCAYSVSHLRLFYILYSCSIAVV